MGNSIVIIMLKILSGPDSASLISNKMNSVKNKTNLELTCTNHIKNKATLKVTFTNHIKDSITMSELSHDFPSVHIDKTDSVVIQGYC